MAKFKPQVKRTIPQRIRNNNYNNYYFDSFEMAGDSLDKMGKDIRMFI
jgi:hypothetical protein